MSNGACDMSSHLLITLLFLGICLPTASRADDVPPPLTSELANASERHALVAAEAVSVQVVLGKGKRVAFEIAHVYAGPKSLKGSKFFAWTLDEGTRARGVLIPIVVKGETGIFALAMQPKSDEWRLVRDIR